MIPKKDFYFIRHGQTNHNLLEEKEKAIYPDNDIPLNETGRIQAETIEPIISLLPIKTVCASPMRRAQETKKLITPKLQVEHFDILDLTECSHQIWREMTKHGAYSKPPNEGMARQFMDRIRSGMNQALSLPGPALVVAHGGIHWALCCMLGIEEHQWTIDNCVPVHFFIGEDGKWKAKKIS